MWEIAVHLAVAGGVYDGVFMCCPFFPRDVLDGIFDLIESVSESFPTYPYGHIQKCLSSGYKQSCLCFCPDPYLRYLWLTFDDKVNAALIFS